MQLAPAAPEGFVGSLILHEKSKLINVARLQITPQQMPQDVQSRIAKLVDITEPRDQLPFKRRQDTPAPELFEPFHLKTLRRRVP